MLVAEGLSRRFGDDQAVDEVSFELARGELLVLLGGSGSGKTTILKLLNRLIEADAGRVLLAGEDTSAIPGHELRRRIGYVFQGIGLFPHMSVAENIAVTPRLLGWSEQDIRERVDEMLELVELDPADYRDRAPSELSGGQAQRIGVARALAARPELLLFDEPFGALDPITRHTLQERLLDIRAELEFTAVFVTHDIGEALILGDRIAVLAEGRLRQIGPPAQLLRDPADDYVATLMRAATGPAEKVNELLADGEAERGGVEDG